MIDTNRFYINYEVHGMMVCCDGSSVVDDITLTVMHVIPGERSDTIGQVQIQRFPSDERPSNQERVASGYDMRSAMTVEESSRAHIICKELRDDDNANRFVIGELRNSDMYVIKNLYIKRKYRNQGIGSYILKQLPAIMTRITNDTHPFFMVVPAATESGMDLERVRHFFQKNRYNRLSAGLNTWFHCS